MAEADDLASPFLAWLLSEPPAPARPAAVADDAEPGPAARSVLDRLDAVIASEPQRHALLPRAPQVLPRLMSALRDENYAAADIAARLSQDAVLCADVIRSANGAHRSGNEPISDIAHAVQSIGSDNLRRVIAQSVLRPIFDVRGTSLSALAAPQIWADADFKARLCSALAAVERLDPLDGFLAGMLHDTGWTALMRALDGLSLTAADVPMLLEPATTRALGERRDTLFSALMRPWQLSAPLTALADEIAQAGLAGTRSPLGQALRSADRLAAGHCLDRAGRLPGGMAVRLLKLPPAAQACFRDVSRSK